MNGRKEMETWEKDNRWKMVTENIKKVERRRDRINHYSPVNREVRVSEGRWTTEKTGKKMSAKGVVKNCEESTVCRKGGGS